jgi:uncharacterized protein
MGKLLVLVLLVVIAVWLIKRALRASSGADPAVKKPIQGELVTCARCGLNLPREEAREAGGVLFCSEEHARLGRS